MLLRRLPRVSARPKHIIFSQHKNIGDVILTFSAAALVKERWPDCRISLLCQRYTHPVVQQSLHIDQLIDWTTLTKQSDHDIANHIRHLGADVVVHMASNHRIAKVTYLAAIPLRIGSGQKWYHWRYTNCRINQGRRHARSHELQLNAQLLSPLGFDRHYPLSTLIKKIKLPAPDVALPDVLTQQLNNTDKPIAILHPGSHGHGREWPQAHFVTLAHKLKNTHAVIFTGTANEGQRFDTLIQACPNATDTMGQLSLAQLMVLISRSDVLVSSGTGPAHLAAAMGQKTITLFPPRSGISPRRWRPPGEKVVAMMHPKMLPCLGCHGNNICRCMAKLTPEQVSARITA